MITTIDLSKDMNYQTIYLAFNVFSVIIAIVIPVFISVFISKVILTKETSFRIFFPFIASVMFFTAIACVVWEAFIYDRIYHEWDTFFIPRFNLIFHEVPNIGNQMSNPLGSWIAEGWTVAGLNLLAFLMRFVIYAWAFTIATIWGVKEKEITQGNFIKVLLLSIIILLVLSFIIPFGFDQYDRYTAIPVMTN